MDWLAIWNYLITTGTNQVAMDLFIKNILVLWLIVTVTPWAWDNALFNKIKEKFTQEESVDEEPK